MSGLLRILGFQRLVRRLGKSFANLSDIDVADMIEAHINEGSRDFHASALSEFMLVPNECPRLEEIRRRVALIDESSRTADLLDGLRTASGIARLKALASELRERGLQ
jgi:hypothetical protein